MKFDMERIKEESEYCLNCKAKPCTKGCPLENNIPTFIKCIKEEKYEEAYNVLSKTTVLQPICGIVCPHKKQCEGSCIRGIKSNSVAIGDLESFIGNMAIVNGYKIEKCINEKNNNKKIAIIGGGPAGLTAAAFLAKNNYSVTIYEKYNELGGILRRGIPDFRLNKNILDDTISKILELGIEVKYSKKLGEDYSLSELKEKYDSVLLSFGANVSAKMAIPGEDLKGVYGGNELLEKSNYPELKNKRVAVIGGGNVAIDVARTLKRKNADVYVIYRRTEKEMPAEKKEIEAAKKENINFLFQNNIIKILGNDKVEKIECIKTKLVKKNEEERLYPVNIENSNYDLDMDYVVMAVGSKVDKEVLNDLDLKLNKWGFIDVDENYMTSKKGIFACGDLAGVKATVAYAARSGRDAANAIINYIK